MKFDFSVNKFFNITFSCSYDDHENNHDDFSSI